MKYGAIDVGTNTALLLIVDRNGHDKEILDLSTITRLGEGVRQTGRLSEGAMERGLKTLARYRKILDDNGVEQTICVGTSALREASNSDVFLKLAEERLSLKIRVISEREEAFYTYLSVKGDDSIPDDTFLIIDIGGGSTEIIEGDRYEFRDFVSLPAGTVKLTEMFVAHDPPEADELYRLEAYARELLPVTPFGGRPCTLVGMGGTITNLAAMLQSLMEYDKGRVHGFRMTMAEIEELIEKMRRMTTPERRIITGMEQGREDIILQGALLLREIMVYFCFESLVVSTKGVRYGVLSSVGNV